ALLHLREPVAKAVLTPESLKNPQRGRVAAFLLVERENPVIDGRWCFALAKDHGGHTLRDHAHHAAVPVHELLNGLRLDVDEAGRYHQAGGVDPPRGLRILEHASGRDARDPASRDGHVSPEP